MNYQLFATRTVYRGGIGDRVGHGSSNSEQQLIDMVFLQTMRIAGNARSLE